MSGSTRGDPPATRKGLRWPRRMLQARRAPPAGALAHPEQILWLTLLVLMASLPLLTWLDWRIGAFVALIVALRLAALRWRAAQPGRWTLVLLTGAGVGTVLWSYYSLSGQRAGSAFFLVMLVLKLLELRHLAEVQLVLILLGFLLAVQFLFEQSPLLALYLGAVAFGILTLTLLVNGGLGRHPLPAPAWIPTHWRTAPRLAARLSLQALPITLILFLLFPRLDAPLWNLGLDRDQGLTGISDSLELGSIGELVVDGSLAFRVRFDTPPPATDRLYWRGPVLWHTDGRRWTRWGAMTHPPAEPPASPSDAPPPSSSLLDAQDLLSYEITLEPTGQYWLFALDLPVELPPDSRLSADYQLLSTRPLTDLHRYRATSALAYRTAALDPESRARALQLPANVTPRLRALVAAWRASAPDAADVVRQALRHFNREAFEYTLLPPRLGANPVDQFLFETRSGFCEHYASSFVLLMRIAGIPARIVLGYHGAELNPLGDHYRVTQADAHAWAEVHLEGSGWVRVDPTAAVDPSRIDHRSAARVVGLGNAPPRFILDDRGLVADWIKRARLVTDSLDAAWKHWVLDFSAATQRALLERLGLDALGEYALAGLMLLGVWVVLGLILIGLLRQPVQRDPLERQFARWSRRLARIGLRRARTEGPRAFAERVMRARPDLAPQVERLLAIYLPARFGPRPDPEAARQFASELRQFRPRRQVGRRA